MVFPGVPSRFVSGRHGLALLSGGSPIPFPPSSTACVRRVRPFGGDLSSVSLSPGSRSELALLGFLSPPCSRWVLTLCLVAPWPSSAGAGPALAWPPTNASDATLSYSRRGCMPFSVVVATVSVECSGGVLCAAGSLCRLHHCFRRPRCASLRRAVASIGWLLPSCSGGGWVLVPSPLPP